MSHLPLKMQDDDGALPDELAILREYQVGEARVLAEAETPAEHVRHALQLLAGYDPRGTSYRSLGAIEARLRSALTALEPPRPVDPDIALHPITVQEVEDLVHQMDADPALVAVRLLNVQRTQEGFRRRLVALERRMHGAIR